MRIRHFRLVGPTLVSMALAMPCGVLAEKKDHVSPLKLVDANGTTMGLFYPTFKLWNGQGIGTAVVVLDLGLSIGPVAVSVKPLGAVGEPDTRNLTWAPARPVRFNARECSGTPLLNSIGHDAPGFAYSTVVPAAGGGWTLYATTRAVGETYHSIWSILESDGVCHTEQVAGYGNLPEADVVLPLTFVPPFRVH